jgi:hypothetical protein
MSTHTDHLTSGRTPEAPCCGLATRSLHPRRRLPVLPHSPASAGGSWGSREGSVRSVRRCAACRGAVTTRRMRASTLPRAYAAHMQACVSVLLVTG